MEHIFGLLNRSAGNQIVLAAEIEGETTLRAWRQALDALQRRHPLLSTAITLSSNGLPYFEVPSVQEIPLRFAADAMWVERAIATEWLDSQMADELAEPFDTESAPLIRAVLAHCEQRSVVLLVGNHAICDGLSLSLCFRDLLRSLNGEHLEPLPIPKSLDQLCGISTETSQPVPPGEGIQYPRDTPRVHRVKLSADLTERIILRARAEHTTMHGALCSAMVHAGWNASAEWREKSLRIFSPVDVRSVFGIGDDQCGLFLASSSVVIERNASESFWAVARQATQGLNVPGARGAICAQTQGQRKLLNSGLDAVGAVKIRQNALARDIMLTNMGRLRFQTEIGRFKLTSMWGPLALSGYPGDHTVGVATVEGSAHLTLASRSPLPSMLELAEVILIAASKDAG
ncbi:condensation domain-containing protein [Paraburkholderia sp. RL18-101-BIB-B]|uniref:phthiocerol/phthiodiolone dimycocerosyl transferase family protein n=1 Tax=unclassified Paraburkholderia TaxID=2615204 RepID=UPI0038B88177